MLVTSWGCAASIPAGRQGIEEVRVEGAEKVDEDAVKERLASMERPSWLPWTPWPLYDEIVFERDRERIERIYRAYGFYEARVTDAQVELDDSERHATLVFTVEEGRPILVRSLRVTGLSGLEPPVARAIEESVELEPGARFEEAAYDDAKAALERALGNASFAAARVTGKTLLDPEERTADVFFHVSPGRPCRFGRLTVEGNEDLPALPVVAAAGIRPGEPYSEDALQDARVGIYTLGAFASVETVTDIDQEAGLVHVHVKVVPGRRFRFGIGVGVESGGPQSLSATDGTSTNFAQWDVHLLGRIEHRNFLGGMRRLRIEERPRLIFDDPFPGARDPNPGNSITADFWQPAFIEARTTLAAHARWDVGPDPYGGQYYRSDLVVGLGPERRFLGGALLLSASINGNFFSEIPGIQDDGPYDKYFVTFLQYIARLDHRDNPQRPRSGSYLEATLQHAGYFLPSDWDYVRITPEARGYQPLPFGMVFAARLRLGMLFVTDTAIEVPEDDTDGFVERLANLGPLRQRLRGGGGNSVRGYAANTLGDVTQVGNRLDSGGLRQWETSLELRVPFTEDFGSVLFLDAGDVTRLERFRFDQFQTTVGLGLRYHTLVGPLRLDVGFAPERLQYLTEDRRIRDGISESRIFGVRGNVQFTIGEAF